VEFGWNTLGLRQIFAACDSENIASRRAIEKLGMQFVDEGTRKNRSMGDEIRRELVYELLRPQA